MGAMGAMGFLYQYLNGPGKERKGNVLFNDTLNTFYLQLYGVRHMVKDHSDSEKGDRIAHITAFVTPVV